MLPANQLAIVPVAQALYAGIETGLPVVLSINKFLDAPLYNKLMATENPATLSALAALYE